MYLYIYISPFNSKFVPVADSWFTHVQTIRIRDRNLYNMGQHLHFFMLAHQETWNPNFKFNPSPTGLHYSPSKWLQQFASSEFKGNRFAPVPGKTETPTKALKVARGKVKKFCAKWCVMTCGMQKYLETLRSPQLWDEKPQCRQHT